MPSPLPSLARPATVRPLWVRGPAPDEAAPVAPSPVARYERTAPVRRPSRLPLDTRSRTTPPPRVIENPRTGERLTFLKTAAETRGRSLLVELALPVSGSTAMEHLHLRQAEHLEVCSGRVWMFHGGRLHLLLPGETYTIPAGSPHDWWNPGPEATVVRITYTPALELEHYFRTTFGLAREGRLRGDGRLPLLQVALLARAYQRYVADIPVTVQRILWAVLAPLARVFGYRERYLRYSPRALRAA